MSTLKTNRTLSMAFAAAFASLTPVAAHAQSALSVEAVEEAVNQAKNAVEQLEAAKPLMIPTGAIVAFNADSCPGGWSEFTRVRGRTIIGTNPDNTNGLSTRNLGDVGGEERHTLTVAEMPAHSHFTHDTIQHDNTPKHVDHSAHEFGLHQGTQTGSTGGNQAHNVMQPFLALLFCRKD